MRRLTVFVLILALICAFCGVGAFAEMDEIDALLSSIDEHEYTSPSDPDFLRHVEDEVYAQLDGMLPESDFIIEDVSAIYISREYLDEVAYNTKANIYFGFSLEELNQAFTGTKYVFTCDNGETIAKQFEEFPDDMTGQLVANIAIGVGIILVCVVVTVISDGAAAPAAGAATLSTASKISLIFGTAAETAADFALTGAASGATISFIKRGIDTNWEIEDMLSSQAFGNYALDASESFKWGAIGGAVTGGFSEAMWIHKVNKGELTPRQAELNICDSLGGEMQVSYLNGERVTYGTTGSVRPDIVVDNVAVEVKCYDLSSKASLSVLKTTLSQEVEARLIHLPEGMTQMIILDVEGRGYTASYVESVISLVEEWMQPIYPDIPVYAFGLTY